MTTPASHPRDLSADAWRLSFLIRMLRTAAASGSDRHVVLAWAEAMALWHGLEVHAYVDDLRGRFVHVAALPGADMTAVPSTIEAAALERGAAMAPLAKSDADRLQFTTAHVVMCRPGTAPGWLLAVCGPVTPDAGAVLAVYLRLLEESLTYGTLASVSRMTGALIGDLFGNDDSPSRHAELAMDSLRRTLGLKVASLILRSAAGAPLITVGDWQSSAVHAANPGSRLVVLRHSVDRYSLALGIATQDGRQLTPQEATVVEKAADLLELWAQQILRTVARGPVRTDAWARAAQQIVTGAGR